MESWKFNEESSEWDGGAWLGPRALPEAEVGGEGGSRASGAAASQRLSPPTPVV